MTKINPIHFLPAVSLAGIFLTAEPLHGNQILFADSFDRADSTTSDGSSLNQSNDGKSGTLGALTWTGRTDLLDTGNIVEIKNNRLRMDAVNTNGSNGGLAYLSDHNFIDADIKAAGSFIVSIDISSTSSSGESRIMGFGIGQSLAELDALGSASPTDYPSDVYIGYDDIGTTRGIVVYENGLNVTPSPFPFPDGTPSRPDTLMAVFTFANMNAGSPLNYEIFLDGFSVGTGSTTWGATDQNYISITSTYSNPSTFDHFSVSVPGPPIIVAKQPSTNATGVISSTNLIVTFDEPITLGTAGSVTIRNLTNPSDTVISLPGPDPDGALTASGLNLIIDPAVDLIPGNEYLIELSSGVVQDLSGNGFAGLLQGNASEWRFTVDSTPPMMTEMTPMAGSIGFQPNRNLTLNFDENVLAVAGKTITIRLNNGNPVETIDASAVVISGARVLIPASSNLEFGRSYYVTIEAGAFTDSSGNPFAGIANANTWNFTTALTAITYVDATDGIGGNTRATALPQFDTSWVVGSTVSASPNTWSKRTAESPDNIGTNNTIYQALPNGNPSNIPQLTTTISGLTDGAIYNIWVFFQDNTGDDTSPYQNWVIAAGLSPDLNTTYWFNQQPLATHNNNPPQIGGSGTGTISTNGVSEASTLAFTGTPPSLIEGTGSGERRLYAVDLGPVTLSGQTSVDVSIGMLINGNSSTTRTWYDGVGYQLIANSSGSELAITSFKSVGGGVSALTLQGIPNTNYQFRSSTTLDFNPGSLVINLIQANPGDPGTIGGPNNSVVTTDGNGIAAVHMILTDSPSHFVRAQTTP